MLSMSAKQSGSSLPCCCCHRCHAVVVMVAMLLVAIVAILLFPSLTSCWVSSLSCCCCHGCHTVGVIFVMLLVLSLPCCCCHCCHAVGAIVAMLLVSSLPCCWWHRCRAVQLRSGCEFAGFDLVSPGQSDRVRSRAEHPRHALCRALLDLLGRCGPYRAGRGRGGEIRLAR